MMQNIKYLFKTLPSDRILLLFIFICLCKFGFLFMSVNFWGFITQPSSNPIFIIAPDSNSYLMPIEDYIEKGVYSSEVRMPGYGIIYYCLRLFTDKIIALNLLIIFQIILSALSICVLAKIAFLVFKNPVVFYLTLILFLFSSFTSFYDRWILTESFAVSSLILSIYYLVIYFQKHRVVYLLVSGLLFAWLIFLRLAHFPLILVLVLLIGAHLFRENTFSWKKKILHLCIFLFPFITADAYWISYNHRIFNDFNPFAKKIEFQGFGFQLAYFCASWGGSPIFWDKDAEINWFCYYGENCLDNPQLIPTYIYTSQFNRDSLINIRQEIIAANTLSPTQKEQKLMPFQKSFSNFTLSIKTEKPHVYYLIGTLRMLGKIIFHSGSYYAFDKPFVHLTQDEKAVKIFISALYWTVFSLGLLFCLFAFFENLLKLNLLLFISIIPFYIIFIHAVILRVPEPRFLVTAYPMLLLMAAECIFRIGKLMRVWQI